MQVIDYRTMRMRINYIERAQLFILLQTNFNVSLIIIEFLTRIRIRINGIASVVDEETIT